MQVALTRTMHRVLDWVYPPQLLQGGPDQIGWSNITFLDDPCCVQCGFPFDFDQGEAALCAKCIAYPPKFDQCRAGFKYDDHSRAIVLSFKHGGNREYLQMFVSHMKRAGRQFLPDADFIVPVPLHPSRLIHRRYNQAAILGRALSQRTGITFDPHGLLRHRRTASQGIQTAKGRFRNVRGAFSISDKVGERYKSANIVLIDDVYTTGATLNACARTLKKAGAKKVDVITLARVVRGQPIPT